jgi:NADPH:quinone reductase-like Zn-dependent oxidoreductase
MKAVRIHRFGGPDVLSVEETPVPEPGEGEVRIRVSAASVNPVDYKIRGGGYPRVKADQLPMTLGRDVAGRIDALGPGVTDQRVGEAVYAMLPPGRGGYAEFVTVKAADCARAPGRVDAVGAAAVPLAGLTAWQGLFDQGGLSAGQSVLIHGAAGGVGHLAVQFARARGATVIATARAEDRDFLQGLGADQVIDYKAERFEDAAPRVDMVFDLVDGETQDRSWTVLKDGGALISTLRAPDEARAAERHARAGVYMAHPDGRELEEIARLIDSGQVTPTVARTYPLEAAAAAEQALEQEHVRGKIVLQVG